MSSWLLILSLTALGYCAVYLLLEGVGRRRLRVEQRLAEVRAIGASRSEKKRGRRKNQPHFGFLRISQSMRESIALSGVQFNSETFVLLWIFLTMAPAALVFSFTADLLRSLAFIVVGAVLPPLYINMKVAARRKLFEQQLGDALMIVANGLRAGFSFPQALGNVTQSLPDPIGGELKTATREMQLGVSAEEALNAVAERMQSDDLRLLTTAVVVQQQVGGNLSEIIDTIAQTIRDRLSIKRAVKTLTAQGRISGKVIGAVPLVLIVAISLFSPGYLTPLFSTLLGRVLLVLGAILEMIGFWVIRKIVDIKL